MWEMNQLNDISNQQIIYLAPPLMIGKCIQHNHMNSKQLNKIKSWTQSHSASRGLAHAVRKVISNVEFQHLNAIKKEKELTVIGLIITCPGIINLCPASEHLFV